MDEPRPPLISGGAVVSLLLTVGLLYVASLIFQALRIGGLHAGVVLLGLPVLIAIGVAIVLVAALSFSAWKQRRSLDRERRGLCARCGYDIRGAPHDRCPDCGLPVLRRRDPVTGEYLDKWT